MMERLIIQNEQDIELKKELENIDFNLDYGSVKIQIRNGKPSLVTIERTIQLDGASKPRPEITTRAPIRTVPFDH